MSVFETLAQTTKPVPNSNKRYKLRSECLNDIYNFLTEYGAKCEITNYIIQSENIMPDCTLEFDSTKNWSYLIHCINALPDCHVMRETLRLNTSYTGKREEFNLYLAENI